MLIGQTMRDVTKPDDSLQVDSNSLTSNHFMLVETDLGLVYMPVIMRIVWNVRIRIRRIRDA